MDYCLSEAGLSPAELVITVFYDKPLLKFGRILETYLACTPRGYTLLLKRLALWLKEKLRTPCELVRGVNGQCRGRYILTQHESHAASAFFSSLFHKAATLTFEGAGEWTTRGIGVDQGNQTRLLKELRFPHSLGRLYDAFSYRCAFRANSAKYKLRSQMFDGSLQFITFTREHSFFGSVV